MLTPRSEGRVALAGQTNGSGEHRTFTWGLSVARAATRAVSVRAFRAEARQKGCLQLLSRQCVEQPERKLGDQLGGLTSVCAEDGAQMSMVVVGLRAVSDVSWTGLDDGSDMGAEGKGHTRMNPVFLCVDLGGEWCPSQCRKWDRSRCEGHTWV